MPDSSAKASIDNRYGELNDPELGKYDVFISVGSANSNELKAKEDENNKKHDSSLKSVLMSCDDAFNIWRYMHEQGQRNNIVRLQFDFDHMGIIARAAREVAVKMSHQR